jgi:phosphoglycerate dehydrogenase-like enzyme
MDAVDLGAAETRGIPVTNVRAGTADVADHAITLLLAAWRMLPAMAAAAKAGQWDLAEHPEFRSIPRLGDGTVGIFGVGAIGRAVADRVRAFGASTIATYRRPEAATPELPHVDLPSLFSETDAVILTASLTPSSHRVVNRSILERAKPGGVLVNVGRGALIVEQDLVWALDAGILRAVALDVRDPEPPDPGSDPLGGRADVIQTPHMAGVSSRALSSLPHLAAEGIVALLRQGGRI